MPERDGYPHGIPGWVDLSTTDVAAAKDFYRGVFGWESTDLPTGPDGPDYTFFSMNEKVVAGCGPIPSTMPQVAFWNSYINVDSVDEAVANTEAAGGSVIMPAMDVMDQGRMAFVFDATGATIGFWEAGAHPGAGLVNEHGALVWNELMTDDPGAAKAFYAAAVGWDEQTEQMEGGPVYTSFKVGDRFVAGMMKKTPDMEFPNYWNIYFAVDDVDAAAAKVTELGGNLMGDPFDSPVGRMAVAADPQGATFSIITMNQDARDRA
jgi:predicted enzyme related to lactoylglutathione lyase